MPSAGIVPPAIDIRTVLNRGAFVAARFTGRRLRDCRIELDCPAAGALGRGELPKR